MGHLAHRLGLSVRNLQSLFTEYVGVNPKWFLRRYRLHGAMERLRAGTHVDCARLALELGNFDQAHLINDFKSMLGYTPNQFKPLRFKSGCPTYQVPGLPCNFLKCNSTGFPSERREGSPSCINESLDVALERNVRVFERRKYGITS